MEKKQTEQEGFRRTEMRRQLVVDKLKERGCRITKQRLRLLDIILEEECSCCKDIYFQAVKEDSKIGIATVYRMVNLLEEIGAISRKNMYKVACTPLIYGDKEDVCIIELDDNTVCRLSARNWNQVLVAGLKECGYLKNQNIKNVAILESEPE